MLLKKFLGPEMGKVLAMHAVGMDLLSNLELENDGVYLDSELSDPREHFVCRKPWFNSWPYGPCASLEQTVSSEPE